MSELRNMSDEDEDTIRGILESTGLVNPHHIRRLVVTYIGVDGQPYRAVFGQDETGELEIQRFAMVGDGIDTSQ